MFMRRVNSPNLDSSLQPPPHPHPTNSHCDRDPKRRARIPLPLRATPINSPTLPQRSRVRHLSPPTGRVRCSVQERAPSLPLPNPSHPSFMVRDPRRCCDRRARGPRIPPALRPTCRQDEIDSFPTRVHSDLPRG